MPGRGGRFFVTRFFEVPHGPRILNIPNFPDDPPQAWRRKMLTSLRAGGWFPVAAAERTRRTSPPGAILLVPPDFREFFPGRNRLHNQN